MNKMGKALKSVAVMIMASVALLCGCSNSASEPENSADGGKEEVVIRVGSNRAIGTVTPYIAETLGYFEDKDYKVEIKDFADGSSLMEAFAAGELDICFVGIAPVATWNGKGLDIRVIGSANSGGHVILTRDDTGINTVADLKGKSMTMPNIGTVTDTILKSYIFPKYDMTEKDMIFVYGIKGPDMVTMLETSREVDAIMTWEPYASMAELDYDNIKVVFDVPKEWQAETRNTELYPVNVISADGEFCDANREAVSDFLVQIKRTVEYIDENHDEGISLISEALDLDKTVVEKSFERSRLTFDVDVESSLGTLEWAYNAGFLDQMPTEDELFDLSFMPED